MKKLIVFISLITVSSAWTQSKYETGMTKAMADMEKASTADDMIKVSAFFERIADAEKDKWLPYYYATYANIMSVWIDEKIDKDKAAEKSLELIAKAEVLEKDNSELYCLRNMIATQQMMVDPMSRWQSHGAEASKALENAKKADPNNPRAYYLEAQSKMNTPPAFGGGKAAAKPIFEKAVELYKTHTLASPFHPNWGKDQAEKRLAECN